MIRNLPPPPEPSARTPDAARQVEVDRGRQAEFEQALRQRADHGAQEQARQHSRHAAPAHALQPLVPRPLALRTVKSERQADDRKPTPQDSDSPPAQTGSETAQTTPAKQPAEKPRDKVHDKQDAPDKTKPGAGEQMAAQHKLLTDKQALKALEAILGQAAVSEKTAPPLIEPVALALLAQTPGDRLLAQVLAAPLAMPLKQDLEQLVAALQVRIQSHASSHGQNTLLQVRLQHLGTIEVQLAHHRGALQIDVQASAGSLLQLQQARGDLLERLHKLNPGQDIQMSFADSQDPDQRSRQRRHVEEEWEPEQ